MGSKSVSKLKSEMLFNGDLTRLVDSMKGVAAAQFHVMEHRRTNLDRPTTLLEELFQVYDFRRSRHPFVRLSNPKRLIVLVTTDSGFLGGLNMKVMQAGLKHDENEAEYFIIGDRGASAIREFGKTFTSIPGINADESRFQIIEKVIGSICDRVLQKEFGQVILINPRAISFTIQRVEAINLLPCPMFFKDKPERVPTPIEQAKNVILESKAADVIEYLTVLWLRRRLIEAFEDAKMAEFGARTMHLEDSYQTLTKNDKALKLQYFKARREKIDQSLRETFTAQLIASKQE
jgi:ATP synthase F1 gamma subunit